MKRITLWLPVVGWCGVIFAFSSLPGSSVPGRYGTLAHFVEYAVLAALVYIAQRPDGRIGRAFAVAVLFASLYGVTDEVHQAFVPMRTPDPMDWLVDTAGAVFGAGATAFIGSLARRFRPQ